MKISKFKEWLSLNGDKIQFKIIERGFKFDILRVEDSRVDYYPAKQLSAIRVERIRDGVIFKHMDVAWIVEDSGGAENLESERGLIAEFDEVDKRSVKLNIYGAGVKFVDINNLVRCK